MRIPLADAIANFSETASNIIFRNHFAVYPNPFAKGDEVRGGEKTGAMTGGATDGIDHSADGALPIGAGDVNDRARRGGFRAADSVNGGLETTAPR